MKTVIKFILIAFVVSFQSIQFASAEEPVKSAATYKYTVYGEIPVVESSFEEEHFLGAAISPKWNTFQQNYIHEYSVEVGFSDSGTEIIKPSVFNAVERANKYVKKSLKKGLMTKEEAVKVMAHILDCANVICFENETQSFESAAKEAKSGEQVVELFQQVELVVI
ncbi:MAG: hypothetical protein IJY59_05380 [Bacteroidaceae bacterium]|nr:hypothetical protein [Bacteroidaceae bacterium]